MGSLKLIKCFIYLKKSDSSSPQWNWNWGQLPERQKPAQPKSTIQGSSSNINTSKNKESSSSSRLLGSMFNLISSSDAKVTSNVGSMSSGNKGEIYLDDTEKLDSEVAALYLNQKSYAKKTIKPSNISTIANQQPAANSTKGNLISNLLPILMC